MITQNSSNQISTIPLSEQRRIHEDDEVRCGDIMYLRDDGSPSRRLCGGCSSLTDTGMQNPDGCMELLESTLR